MNTTPTIGTVVAVRNGISHLGAALDGVLSQDPAPTDVVVLDGGSTDGSAELANGFEGVRVVAQLGVGLGAARNQALRAVGGDLVAFCDSDDRWPVGSLACRVAHLSEHPDCDAVVGQMVTVALGDEPVPAGHRLNLGVPRAGYTPGALLARRRVFDVVGRFDERLRIATDSDWFVRLRQSACPLDVVDETVLIKGIRSSSLSHDVTAYRRELMHVVRAHLERRRSRG